MCGRFALSLTPREAAEIFEAGGSAPNFAADWNVAPTKSSLIVRLDPATGARRLDVMSWGLLPHFVRVPDKGRAVLINARAETVRQLTVFRGAYQKRRAIIPANAFYEWQRHGKLKQPTAIARADDAPLAFAGLWESWTDPLSSEVRQTFAIITTGANDFMRPIHERMPVILEKADFAAWLDIENDDAVSLMRSAKDGVLRSWPVSTEVNSVRNNGSQLLAAACSESVVGGPNSA